MAFTKQLPTDVLSAIADQVGTRLQPLPGGELHFIALNGEALPSEGLEVGESFEVWKFVPDISNRVAQGEDDITQLTRRSGIWHHQLRRGQQAFGFARSKPLGADADSWSVRDICTSQLAAQIEEGIAWIDANIPEDQVEVRMLSSPAQQVEAFWFVSQERAGDKWNNQLLIIKSPDNLSSLGTVVDSQSLLASFRTRERGMGLRESSPDDIDES